MAVIRITLLGIPLDHLPEEDIEQTILNLAAQEHPQHIIFLTLWDLLKARRNAEFRALIEHAALCLPLSKSLLHAARFLNLTVPIRRDTFDVIIRILNVIDSHYKSLYLFGCKPPCLTDAERNVRITFPHIRIVGRFRGYYHKSIEPDIITSMVKAHPSLILAGNGIQGGAKWIYRNAASLPGSICIYDETILEIFAKRRKRISDSTFRKGYEFLPQLIRNPFKIFYLFRYVLFFLLVLFYKLFKK